MCALCRRSHTLRLFSVLMRKTSVFLPTSKFQYSSHNRSRNSSRTPKSQKCFIPRNFYKPHKTMEFVMCMFAGNKTLLSLAACAGETLKTEQMYHAKWTTSHHSSTPSCIVRRHVSSLRRSKCFQCGELVSAQPIEGFQENTGRLNAGAVERFMLVLTIECIRMRPWRTAVRACRVSCGHFSRNPHLQARFRNIVAG